MRSYGVDAIVSTDTAGKTGGVKHGLTSQAWLDLHLLDSKLSLVNNFDVCGYGELQVLHRKDIDIGRLQCQNASTALKFDKRTLCQQAKADCHSLA